MTDLQIRRADTRDVATLFALMRALAAYEGHEAALLTDEATLVADRDRYSVFLAERDGVALGFVSYTVGYSIWWGGDYLALDDLYVVAAARGAGVGESLMRAIAAECLSRGYRYARWTAERENLRAQNFYGRLGAQVHEKGVYTWRHDAMKVAAIAAIAADQPA